jgi:hypothetical protein
MRKFELQFCRSAVQYQSEGKFMKEVAILLLVALLLTGCGNNSTNTQTAAGGTWSSQMVGGVGLASGFGFTTSFSVSGSGGNLSISTFEFVTDNNPSCFPVFPLNGGTVNGTMMLTESSNFQVTGPFAMTVHAGDNTLILSGTVIGTENGVEGNANTLSDAVATGTWTFTGGPTIAGCNVDTTGSFKMTQSQS